MDNVSIWFLILLVIVSGVIAAVGDWLGRRLGKKRLKVWGLRPKHTAILMTFVAGMVITVLTVAILSSMSGRVRTWLIEGEKLQDRLTETQLQVERSEKEVKSVNAQLSDEKSKLEQEKENVRIATEESKKMSEAAARLKEQVSVISTSLVASTKEFKIVQFEYKKVQDNANILKTSNDEYLLQQRELMVQNRSLMAKTDEYFVQIDSLKDQISRLQTDAARAEKDKIFATNEFAQEKSRIQEERTKALADLSKTSLDLTEARQNLVSLQLAASVFYDDNVRSRFNPLVYNRGDELARFAVRSKLSQTEAQTYLKSALDAASKDAVQRGAERAPDTRSSAAFGSYNVEGKQVTAEMQFTQAVGEISANTDDQVIVVRALTNAFVGEWIRVKVDVYPNPVVYRDGDLIVEARIDGTKGVQGVTQQIIEFISKQLRERAIRDGMVPAVGRQPELGEISQEKLQQIVADIVEANRTINMRLHANRETRAADTLQLDVRLR